MSIIRNHINFSSNFVQIPNDWMRDARLSHRARGILAEIMTHSDGWEITVQHLVRNGTEGREAVRTAIKELVKFGYLRQERAQDETGRMLGSQYTIQIPPDDIEPDNRETGSWGAGKPDAQEPPTKNTNLKEDHLLEHTTRTADADALLVSEDLGGNPFDEWWKLYPLKKSKQEAKDAYAKAAKKHKPVHLLKMLEAYKQGRKREEQAGNFVANWPYASTWLNQERWTDYTEAPMPTTVRYDPWSKEAYSA